MIAVDRLIMLPAVELDDQIVLETDEVREVRADSVLAAKPEAANLPVAKVSPQPSLGVGRVKSKAASEAALVVVESHRDSLPTDGGRVKRRKCPV